MKITLILATDKNGLIGNGPRLPWNIPADMKHFRRKTIGKTVIMGRKTCDTLFVPLADRQNIVLTSNREFERNGFKIIHNLDDIDALDIDELMVIGGAEIYNLFIDKADSVLLTLVDGKFNGDTYFDTSFLDTDGWILISSEPNSIDLGNKHKCTFMEYQKKRTTNE